jgi:hypothetical protein
MKQKIRIAVCVIAMVLAVGLVAFRSNSGSSDTARGRVVTTPPTVELKPAPPTPIAEEKARLGDDETWNPEWDAVIERALPADLLSPKMGTNVKQFCPRFSSMSDADKRAFWAYFFQALSGAEAGLRATSNVRHTEPEVAVVDGVSHRMVRSEGLLQLTYEDATRYGCDFDWNADKRLSEHDPEKTILQPENNLVCGVNILENQLIVKKKALLAKSSYWSTLRPGWPGFQVFLKQMSNVPAECGRRHITNRTHAEASSAVAATR